VDALKGVAVKWPHLREQAEAIVDDLTLEWEDRTRYHQLKNVQSLSWTGGDHPLMTDFELQKKFADDQKIAQCETVLVVPTAGLANSMKADMPDAIKSHSSVEEFPYCGGSLNRLVLEHQPLRELLTELTRVDNPTSDELGCAFGALIMGILHKDGDALSEEMFREGQKARPNLIRLLPGDLQHFEYATDFEKNLAKVDGLSYGLSRGFFFWEAFGTSGVLSYNCLSDEFAAFQRRIVQHAPETFDDFWGLL
jgi:hypothetical protein